MCFGRNKKGATDEPPPRPVNVAPPHASSSFQPSPSSHPGPSLKADMPQQYAPPSGPPPPSDSKNNPFYDYAEQPPPGPPPASSSKAPAAGPHDWEAAVPDTSLLPPPPNYFSGFDRSPANNATEEDAELGEQWCREQQLYQPLPPTPEVVAALNAGNINVFAPPQFTGSLSHAGLGHWQASTRSSTRDTSITTFPALYTVGAHSPLVTGQPKTVYYEVKLLPGRSRKREVTLALGFSAPPYPPFRLPGWHRGSLAVHGDDGHRYINDRWGGKDFTKPFRPGETVGIGMQFSPGAGGLGIRVDVFFTRDGREDGRWNLHEETDLHEDLPVTGLEGMHDLCASVGVFDDIAFELVFNPSMWAWRGLSGGKA